EYIMPEHFDKIFGWFDFGNIYIDAVNEYDNCCFIETGNFLGKSAVFMAEYIKECKKNITLICVDFFPTPDELKRWESSGAGQGAEF
ncbi:hypothetical protein, partial [Bacillus cereus]|uniref:hypothetical protein n=1 Tax=Bacillus cereus TaxID=1396 RepID=UPI0034D3C9B4